MESSYWDVPSLAQTGNMPTQEAPTAIEMQQVMLLNPEHIHKFIRMEVLLGKRAREILYWNRGVHFRADDL